MGKVQLEKDHFNTLVFRYDAVRGLITAPYKEYPYNYTGLLHACNDVLIYSIDQYKLEKAEKIRKFALDKLINK